MTTRTRDIDEDLLPGGPPGGRIEAEEDGEIDDRVRADDNAVLARLDAATGATSDHGDATPKVRPMRLKRPRLPALPTNLDAAVLAFPVRLKLVSLGKSIANVTATLGFDVPIPQDFRPVLGEHAYTVGFLGGFLGEGVRIVDVPLKADAENRLVQTMKVQIPRFLNEHTDQLLLSVAPLIGGKAFVERLFGLEWPWRLNIPVDIEGDVEFFAMQQAFDLTSRAE